MSIPGVFCFFLLDHPSQFQYPEMVDFYSALATYYDEVFPPDPAAKDFVSSSMETGALAAILDIGCATGKLAFALAEAGHSVTAIDLDERMIGYARQSQGNAKPHGAGNAREVHPVEFIAADMLDIKRLFSGRLFDRVLCFGNTLVHLPDREAISSFLSQARGLLARRGKLLIQILNYDHILSRGIANLPAIETQNLVFTRAYAARPDNRLDFSTSLQDRNTNTIVKSVIPLLPLVQAEADRLLSEAGFGSREYFGSFTRASLSQESFVLVVEASP